VSMGYSRSLSDLVKDDENCGILHTGDLAKFDCDGFYYLVGRKKRFLKVFGNRISLDDIENLAMKAGYNCVSSGVDDKLYLYTENENQTFELKRFIAEKLMCTPLR